MLVIIFRGEHSLTEWALFFDWSGVEFATPCMLLGPLGKGELFLTTLLSPLTWVLLLLCLLPQVPMLVP